MRRRIRELPDDLQQPLESARIAARYFRAKRVHRRAVEGAKNDGFF